MAKLIQKTSVIEATGNKPKIIEEFIGRVNSQNNNISIAKMKSPQGWVEPGQTPEFDEYTIVLKGTIQIETKEETYKVDEGQSFYSCKGEWIKYSIPFPNGAEYVAICLPTFSIETVNRDK